MCGPDGYAGDWTPEQREAWIAADEAGLPVLRAMAEHEPGTCDHCDVIRDLEREAVRRA